MIGENPKHLSSFCESCAKAVTARGECRWRARHPGGCERYVYANRPYVPGAPKEPKKAPERPEGEPRSKYEDALRTFLGCADGRASFYPGDGFPGSDAMPASRLKSFQRIIKERGYPASASLAGEVVIIERTEDGD